MLDGAIGDHAIDVVVDVWECHETQVAAFRLCSIAGIGAGMGGIVWMGIEAVELRAALALLRVPRKDWPGIAADVQYMGAEVASTRNKQAHERSKQGG